MPLSAQGEPRLFHPLRDHPRDGLAAFGDHEFFPGSLDFIEQLQALCFEFRRSDRFHMTSLNDQSGKARRFFAATSDTRAAAA